MSGDVQPRKRKDKRKKQRDSIDRKSEGELSFLRQSSIQEDDESSHGVHITKMGGDDVHLHVHHDHGTGGHWCAKIFFFSLLAILVGLISLIILENRGISDLDTPLSESRFSNYFDGWVDEKRESHDEHDAVQASLEDEHDEPFEEEEAVSEGDEEDDHEEEDHEEEVDEDEEDENEEADEEEHDNAEEQVTKEEYDEPTKEDEDNDEDNDEDVKYEDNATIEANEVEETVEDEANEDNDEDNEDNVERSIEEEEVVSIEFTDHTAELNNASENEEDENEEDENEEDGNDDNDEDTVEANTKEDNKSSADPFDEDDDDDDGTFELFENVVDNDAEELLLLQKKAQAQAEQMPVSSEVPASEENEETEPAEEKSSWLSSLAVKLGVGVALALVARLVLLRKKPNTNNEAPTEAMMKRRLTIAGPEDTFPEDVDAPLLPTDEFSEEEEIIEEEIIEFLEEEIEEEVEEEEEIEVDEDGIEIERYGKYVPETFEQLNAMYREQKEPSPHPTTRNQPHFAHTSETPAMTSFKEIPTRNLTSLNQSSANQKAPPVFIAPPPPSPASVSVVKDESKREISPTVPAKNMQSFNLPTATNIGKSVETPTVTVSENSPSQIRKRTVTHDVDYQPDADEIAYDDDQVYDSDDMDEDDENDDDGDDEDISDIDDISDVDDTDLMNRLDAKYGKLPPSSSPSAAKEYESDEDPDDPTWTRNY